MTKTKAQLNFSELLPLGSKARSKLRAQIHPRASHGGNPSLQKRKTMRPFTKAAPVHLVLRAKRARGSWSLLHRRNRAKVQQMVYAYGDRFQVKVYQFANVGNHLHLLVKAADRKNLADFLRVLAGRVAVVVTGAEKGRKKIGRFWDYLTWSRLVSWGADFYGVRKYIIANQGETMGSTAGESKETRERILKPADLVQTTAPPSEWEFV